MQFIPIEAKVPPWLCFTASYNPAQSWMAAEMLRSNRWKFTISDGLIQEFQQYFHSQISSASELDLTLFNQQILSLNPIAIQQARLPKFEQLALQIQRELREGTGIAHVTHFPCHLSEAKKRFFYLVLGLKLGQPIDRYGLLYEVKDTGASYQTSRIPISQTNAETCFHTDSSALDCEPDVVGLMCIRPAQSGGESQVVSVSAIHQHLQALDPTALAFLYQDYIRDIVTPGLEFSLENLQKNKFPILTFDGQNGLTFRYMRYWIERGHRKAEVPLSSAQITAFDQLDRSLNDPQFVLKFQLSVGEILWVNNRTIAHNRTAYEDHSDPQQQRLMLRMWLQWPS